MDDAVYCERSRIPGIARKRIWKMYIDFGCRIKENAQTNSASAFEYFMDIYSMLYISWFGNRKMAEAEISI